MIAPVLQTERLILRAPVQADLDAWAAFMADPEAARYVGGEQPRTVVWRQMAVMTGSWRLKGFGMFSVVDKASGDWIGRAGCWEPEGWPGKEVGWGFRREVRRRGYATEAATAVMDWAFDSLDWSEAIHVITAANLRSAALAKRLGSSLIGSCQLPPPLPAGPVDIWGQTRAQWRARRT